MEEVYSNKLKELIEKNWEREEINNFFRSLLDFLIDYLEIKHLISEVQIEKNKDLPPSDDIFSFGVVREVNNNVLKLKLTNKNPELHPIILLREAYYCFLPSEVLKNKIIKMCINQVVEINLESYNYINKWKKLIRKNIVDTEYVQNQLDRFEKFFKLRSDRFKNPVKFFFEFTRKNITIVEKDLDLFHNQMMHEYMFKLSRDLQNDEIVETIRNLITIFYRVKFISSKSEYKEYFNTFKENSIIETDLSIRKFVENLRWLKNYSFVAPNYKIDYTRVGIKSCALLFQFHPFISKKKVRFIINTFPFLRYIRMSENGFSINIIGYVYIPNVYMTSFIYFLRFLQDKGFITNLFCIKMKKLENNLNLNYFREFHNQKILINKNHQKYDKKYEITGSYNYYGIQDSSKNKFILNPIEFLILDRIRYISFIGFGFQHNKEILNELKSDYINDFRENLNKLYDNKNLKKDFLRYLEKFSSSGLFYIENLFNSIIEIVEFSKSIVENHNIYNFFQFQSFIRNNSINLFSKHFEQEDLNKLIFNKIMPLYFDNKSKFNEEINKFLFYSTILKNFFSLKIFSLNSIKKIIQNTNITSSIYSKKQEKLKKWKNKYQLQDITIKYLEETIKKFLNFDPPIIMPSLISSISTTDFAKYNIIVILQRTPKVIEKLNEIKFYFPRVIILDGEDILLKKQLLYLEIYLQNISVYEKEELISIFYSIFKDNLIYILRIYSHGIQKIFSLKDYYDFQKNSYFYTRDLFSQYERFIKSIFGTSMDKISQKNKIERKFLLSEKNDMDSLVSTVYKRNSWEQTNFDIQKLHKLEQFHKNLNEILSSPDKFRKIKNESFFKQYIQSINFIPQFQRFSFSNYFLWFKTSNLDQINKKSLLINTFLSVKYPAEINEDSSSFLISYLFPYLTPNNSYFNWLLKSKKNFTEYLLFSIKNIYQILHFNYNISPNGWALDANHFSSFAKKVIYKEKYTLPIPSLKRYDLLTISDTTLAPRTQEFYDLKNLYTYQSEDLKSFLAQEKHYRIDSFLNLHSKELLFPYLELKNLGFREVFYITIPNISPQVIDTLIKIFGFFNYCFIFEIEGEFFIQEMNDVHSFENGLFIELHLPDCEFSEFYNAFHEIFDLLGIERYSILHDLVDGKQFLKEAFGDLKFLENYTPLNNLEWNNKDKIWINPKLFDDKFNYLKIRI
jgi:hypothetical protein